ncbi:PAS domain S-box protein [Salinimonas iocasae]|uniref:PAS domain S-box protein n=2 Tax=Salinimonas iocasae TaxID=2572577 RepID=A0A5B7YCT6_9ALTE|nr:PAS domain S-box protein [Salinimonas iocasae]
MYTQVCHWSDLVLFMSVNVRLSMPAVLFGLLYVLAPSRVWAMAAQVQAMPATLFAIGFWSLVSIAVLFIILFVAKVFANKRLLRAQQSGQAEIDKLVSRQDNLPTGIIYLDDAHEILTLNRTAAAVLGQKPDLLMGQPVTDVLPESVRDALSKALQADWEQILVCKLPARDRYFRIRVIPNMPDTTRCNGQLVIEDVDQYEHKLSNAEVMEAHQYALWNQKALGIIQLRPATGDVSINESMAAWLGQSAQDVQSIESLFSDKSKNAVVQLLSRAAEGHSDSIEVDLVCADRPVPVTLYASAVAYTLEDEPLIHLTCINRQAERDFASQAATHKRHFQSLCAMLPHSTYLLNNTLTIEHYNREFAKTFDLESGVVKGQKITELAGLSEKIKKLHSTLQGTMLKQEVITLENEQGQTRTLKLLLQPISENNQRTAVLVVVQDLTDNIALEDERNHARQRLLSFMDQAPMGVVMFDENDIIKESNHTTSRQLGLSGDELRGKSFYNLFTNADDARRAAKKLQRHDRFAELPARLNGALKPLSATLHASKISEIPQEFVCWIGGREEQEFLNTRFEKLVKYASVPVGILSEDGFSHLNSAACVFFGLDDEDELLGKSPDFRPLNVSDADSQMMADKLELAKTQGQVLTFNWQHAHSNEELPCEVTLIPIHRDGALQSVICIWVDLRAIEQSNAARMEAVRLREAAQREVEEKQQMLATSEDKLQRQSATLAETEQSLASTEKRLNQAEEDLSEKLETISDLQQAHKDISEHLASLQDDYASNRALLAESQQINTELEEQLSRSSAKVGSLEQQRSQIADALQYSEKKYRQAQTQLDESRKETGRLKDEQQAQQHEVQQYVEQIDTLKASIEEKDHELTAVSSKIQTLQSQLVSSGQTSEKLREQLLNQRKASEEAEKQRRQIELACQAAEAELAAKARNIDHLQHEMEMLEKMSQQEKGDMEAYARQLQQELEQKQSQLSQTESALVDIRAQAEADREEKAKQQDTLTRLQLEMQEAEAQAKARQEEMAELNQAREKEQARLQEALDAKHALLTDTAQNLEEAKRQNEAAAQEKARQQAIVSKLQEEMQQTRAEAESNQQKLAELNAERMEEHARLQEDLKAKQLQLQEAKATLQDNQQRTESDKEERVKQQAVFEKLKAELSSMESRSAEQQAAIEQTEKDRQNEQEAMEKALAARQAQLDETKAELQTRQQQMDEEKRAREAQQSLLDQLQQEMSEMQARAQQQKDEMASSEKAREEEQQRLTQELQDKQEQLSAAQSELEARQQQMEEEKLAREEQQAMLEQLKSELEDVAQRASKQQEMMSGSDEQWRKHHEEIEAQKKQLQQALNQAENQNNAMQTQLEQSREALTQANSKVSKTQSEEQKLQAELDEARDKAEALNEKLRQQEAQEAELKTQVQKQQSALGEREQSISELKSSQQALTEKLAAVEKEYAQTKASLKQQDSSQNELSDSLRQLEEELNQSKAQLTGKEEALEKAQARLKESESKLAEQEKALIDAQKAELQSAQDNSHEDAPAAREIPEFANDPVPDDPHVWFDLLPYLQQNEQVGSLAQSLTSLMDTMSEAVKDIDDAVAEDRHGKILLTSRNLVKLLRTIHSEPLNDMAERFETDLEYNNVDNISIFWPIARQNLMKTQRVIYSHLYQ